MEASVKVRNGRAVVSVDHESTVPTVRVQRIATRKFNQYRKEHRLQSAWALVDHETHQTGGDAVSTEYVYMQMRYGRNI